jgi:hypothetical protein
VIETVRLKKSCRRCERIVQPAAPTRPVPRGMAGPGPLAHILVAKYDDHLPLYRQGGILARQGADVPRSTLIDRCGRAIGTLGLNPEAHPADALARINDHLVTRRDELLPWTWTPAAPDAAQAASPRVPTGRLPMEVATAP